MAGGGAYIRYRLDVPSATGVDSHSDEVGSSRAGRRPPARGGGRRGAHSDRSHLRGPTAKEDYAPHDRWVEPYDSEEPCFTDSGVLIPAQAQVDGLKDLVDEVDVDYEKAFADLKAVQGIPETGAVTARLHGLLA